jgi:SAM-dependent methyltransferase
MNESTCTDYYTKTYHREYSRRESLDYSLGDEKSIDRHSFLKRTKKTLKNSAILEVGCGVGQFLHYCRDEGAVCLGIEPFEEYSEYARNVLNIEVFTGTLEAYSKKFGHLDGTLDTVCLFHVLEHLASPIESLRLIRGWLKDDGLLYIEVPNAVTTWRWYNQAPTKFFRPVHFFNFTWKTLELVLGKAGFQIIATDREVARRCRVIAKKSSLLAFNVVSRSRAVGYLIFFMLWHPIYLCAAYLRMCWNIKAEIIKSK